MVTAAMAQCAGKCQVWLLHNGQSQLNRFETKKSLQYLFDKVFVTIY